MSGLLFDTHLEWLTEMSKKAAPDLLDDFNQNDLMLQEMHWQLRNTFRFIKNFAEGLSDEFEKEKGVLDETIQVLNNCFEELNKLSP